MGTSDLTVRGKVVISVQERLWRGAKSRYVPGKGFCWEWTGSRSDGMGYGVFHMTRSASGQWRNGYVHRASFLFSRGYLPSGAVVMHKCDNPICIRPSHLRLGTLQLNHQDMVNKNRHTAGERHPAAELTAQDVLEMRCLWETRGYAQDQLADLFHTTKANVSQIVRGKRWKSLLPSDWVAPEPGKWSRGS